MKFVFYEGTQLKILALKQIFLKIYFHNVIYYDDCGGL